MTTENMPPLSRDANAPELFMAFSLQRTEGAGKAGCSMRTRSLASEKMEGHELQSPQVRQRQSGFSCTIGFNGFLRALSGDRAFLSPSPADLPADLMPASRHQDHTTSPSARTPLVRRRHASIASRPHVRDDAQRPSGSGRDGAGL